MTARAEPQESPSKPWDGNQEATRAGSEVTHPTSRANQQPLTFYLQATQLSPPFTPGHILSAASTREPQGKRHFLPDKQRATTF